MAANADALLDQISHLPDTPADPPAFPIKRGVNYSHDAMIDLILANPGIHQNAIARQMGYSASWVSTIIASDAFQSKLAERKDQIVDPILRLTVEEQLKGLMQRSMEVLRDKMNGDSANIPDQLALRTFELSSRAAGFGARVEVKVENNVTNHIDNHADRLVQLLRKTKASEANIAEGEIVGEKE